MQASLAIIGFLCGAAAWLQSGRLAFLVRAIVLLSNWPHPARHHADEKALMATNPADATPSSRRLIKRWARLHAVRTALGIVATLIFLGALT